MSPATRAIVPVLAGVLALSTLGCGHRLERVLLPEQPTVVRLAHERLAPPSEDVYAFRVYWSGLGAGSRIDHYVCAIDPISIDAVDASWRRTTATQQTLTFPRVVGTPAKHESHVFVVRAVGTDGRMSDPAWVAVAEDGYPPIVVITSPKPDPIYPVIVPPEITIQWRGDFGISAPPVKYKYRLFEPHNPDFPGIADFVAFGRVYPDSVRRLYALSFAGWDSVPDESTSVRYTGLEAGTTYLFAIVSFDEQGNYDALLALGWNLLAMQVATPTMGGPVLTMFNEYFNYTYLTGEWSSDPSRRVRVEVPAGRPVTVHWSARPLLGAEIDWYRWALAPVDLVERVPWADDPARWNHWSARSPTNTSATVGPFHPPPGGALTRWLYIEAEDTHGFRSLGIVELVARRPAFNQDLLIVDDTRLRVDLASGAPGEVQPPAGPWPTAAELDTFLFAKGGFPWRSYPVGTVSPPGIFNGYDYDTIGTRGFSLDGVVPLSLLSQYRHVVWYVDEAGANYLSHPSDHDTPITALRLMSAPGMENTLAAYIAQGGKVWLCGGGAGMATLRPWNRVGTAPWEYSARDGELVPGRMMYDFAHWREGVEMLPSVRAHRFGTIPWPTGGESAPGLPGRGWPPNPIPPTPPAPPDYSLLPATLLIRSPATDPVPPLRSPDAFFGPGYYAAEYISRPTFIREDYDDHPGRVAEYSTLDTLYLTAGGVARPYEPCMTYYHGRDNAPVVLSGFSIWGWQRSQCIQLVDWVLQSVWGLPRDPSATRVPRVPPRVGVSSQPPTGVMGARGAPALDGAAH
jgi:hypothetical protein